MLRRYPYRSSTQLRIYVMNVFAVIFRIWSEYIVNMIDCQWTSVYTDDWRIEHHIFMENLVNGGRQGRRVCRVGHAEDKDGIENGRQVGAKPVDRNLRLLVLLRGRPKKRPELIGNTITSITNLETVSNWQPRHRTVDTIKTPCTENQSRKWIQFQTA